MSGHSIRLRFVCGLLHFLDCAREKIAEHLHHHGIEAEPSADADLGAVAGINDGLSKRQVENAVHLPVLQNDRRQDSGQTWINNDPVYLAHLNRLPARNHDLITHQKSLQKNYLNSLPLGSQRVEKEAP